MRHPARPGHVRATSASETGSKLRRFAPTKTEEGFFAAHRMKTKKLNDHFEVGPERGERGDRFMAEIYGDVLLDCHGVRIGDGGDALNVAE